jgi:hypothetical protein
LSRSIIGNIAIAVPSTDEQQAIAAFLDRETAKIDSLIEKVETSIDLLQEYRTALISDAVTGKIDVRDVAFQKNEKYATQNTLSVFDATQKTRSR